MNAQAGRLDHFLALSDAEQIAAIQRLAAAGMSDYDLAAACSISVEQVRRLIGREHCEP